MFVVALARTVEDTGSWPEGGLPDTIDCSGTGGAGSRTPIRLPLLPLFWRLVGCV